MILDMKTIEYKENVEYPVLPEGVYSVEVTNVTDKRTERGESLNVKFTVTEGQHKGVSFFINYDYGHTNSEYASRAKENLKRLCVVSGNPDVGIESGSELIGFRATVETKLKDRKWVNIVKYLRPLNDEVPF